MLTEFAVQAVSKADPKQSKSVALQNALADFSQANFAVASAIDGNPNDGGTAGRLADDRRYALGDL